MTVTEMFTSGFSPMRNQPIRRVAIKFPAKKTHGALLVARETNSVQPLYLFTKNTTVARNVPWEEAMIILSQYWSMLDCVVVV